MSEQAKAALSSVQALVSDLQAQGIEVTANVAERSMGAIPMSLTVLDAIYTEISEVRHLLIAEADDRAKQRRLYRMRLTIDMERAEFRCMAGDGAACEEHNGLLVELQEFDDLWPDTAAVALTAVRR